MVDKKGIDWDSIYYTRMYLAKADNIGELEGKVTTLRECIENAKLLTEKYAYPDSIGWADMESDDVSKLWRILEDALLDGETSPF